jgi:phosphoglycolate phosphatase
MQNMKIKCAVFDLDGTLLNTARTIQHYLNLTLSKYDLPTVSEADTKRMVGNGARILITRAMGERAADTELYDKVYRDYNEVYDADPYYLTKAYDGIPEMLSTLKEQGIILAVLSNKPDTAVKLAAEHFFPGVFTSVLGARDGVPLKPDPSALFNMLDSLGITPDECAYIGDSEPDVLIAKAASVALPIAVSWGFRTEEQLLSVGATKIINHPGEIKGAVTFGKTEKDRK